MADWVLESAYSKDELEQLTVTEAQKRGLDPSIALAQFDNESGFNPFALSPTGPVGAAQFTAKTGAKRGLKTFLPREYRQDPSLLFQDDRTNPEKAIPAALDDMKDLLGEHGGDYNKALAAYNNDPKHKWTYARNIIEASKKRETPSIPQDSGWVLEPIPEVGFMEGLKQSAADVAARHGAVFTTGPDQTEEQRYQEIKEGLVAPPAAPPEGVYGKVKYGAGSAIPQIAELLGIGKLLGGVLPGGAGVGSRMAQTAVPFGVQGLTQPTDKLASAAHGLGMGAALGAIPGGWGRLPRMGAGGALFGLEPTIRGQELEDIVSQAIIGGGLMGLHGRRTEGAPTSTEGKPYPELPPPQKLLPAPYEPRTPDFIFEPGGGIGFGGLPVPYGGAPGMPARVPPETQRLLPGGDTRQLPGPWDFTMQEPSPIITEPPRRRAPRLLPETIEEPPVPTIPGENIPHIEARKAKAETLRDARLSKEDWAEPPGSISLRTGISYEDVKWFGNKLGEFGTWLGKTENKFSKLKEAPDVFPRPTSSEVSELGRFFRLPYWVAKGKTATAEYAQKAIDVSLGRMKLKETIDNEWIKNLRPVTQLTSEQAKEFDRLVVGADSLGRKSLKDPAMTKDNLNAAVNNLAAQFSPEVQGAARTWWKESLNTWYRLEQAFTDLGLAKNDIQELRKEMGFIPYYFPHLRHGKYFVSAVDKQGDTLYREHASNRITWGRLKDKVAKEYPDARIVADQVKDLPEELFFQFNSVHSAKIAEAALSRVKNLTGVDKENIKQAIVDTLRTRGFGKHFIRQQNVPGYETSNARDTIFRFLGAHSGFISKMKATPEYHGVLGEIDAKAHPNTYAYTERYIRDALANTTRLDQTVGKLRAGLFHWFLGAVPKSAVVNLTQNITAGAPYLSQFTKGGGIKLAVAGKDLLKNGRAYWDLTHGREASFKNLRPEEAQALEFGFKSGFINDSLTRELMGVKLGKYGTTLRWLSDASMTLFGNAEKYNRATMFLAAFRIGRNELKMPIDKAVGWAGDAVNSSHFMMGKYNLPEFARGSAFGKVMRGPYTFRTFTHNYIELLGNLHQNDKAAFGRALRNLGLLGGTAAIPIVREAMGLYRAFTGQDVLQEALKGDDDQMKLMHTLARFGLPGLANIDLSGSLSVEVVRQLQNAGDIPKEALGAIGGILFQSIPDAIDSARRGNMYRALEDISPMAAKLPMAAYRQATEGLTTRRGQQILGADMQPSKMTPTEAVGKAVGFQPARSTEQREATQYVREQIEAQHDLQDRWGSKYIRAFNKNDQPGMAEVLNEMQRYNEQAVAKGKPPIDLSDTIKRRLRPQTMAPNKWLPFAQQYQ